MAVQKHFTSDIHIIKTMKSIRTEQFNQPLAENQDDYNTLFINLNTNDPMCPATVCFEFSLEEMEAFKKTGKLYYQQCLFTKPKYDVNGELDGFTNREKFHPMNISFHNPLEPVEEKETRGAKDSDTISDEPHEINAAAHALGVLPITIHFAKYKIDTNNRAEIYKWVQDNKGESRTIEIA